MPLPDRTKYVVASSLRNLATQGLVDALTSQGFQLECMDVVVISPLLFTINLRPQDGGPRRYFEVRVSEPT